MMVEVKVTQEGLCGQVIWEKDHKCSFHVKWLRFNCHCEKCFRPFSRLYMVDKTRYVDVKITSAKIEGEKLIFAIDKEVKDNHLVTEIPLNFLRQNCLCKLCINGDISRMEYIIPANGNIPQISYSDILNDEGMLRLLENVMKRGFCVVQNTPQESKMCIKIAQMLGYLHATITGEYFDVLARAHKHNTVHTTLGLPFHEDLPWYQSEPGVQVLHALRFDDCVVGGESQIVDVYHAAEILRKDFPKHFKTLSTVPGMFETIDYKRKVPAHFQHQKCHIEVDYYGQIVSVHWNPGVESTVRMREEDEEAYYEAYNVFQNIILRPEMEARFRMKTGDTLVFNNHRVVHARTVYESNNGVRHLQGCYANLDDIRSKYMVLGNKFGIKKALPNVGNGSTAFRNCVA